MMDRENKNNVLMNKYEIGRLLGKGTFAKVYYARNIETSQSVAIKVIDKEKVFKAGLIEQIKREISVMRLVKHPNVVQLYEVMATKTKIYFVLEYLKGGELFNKIAKGKLREDVARKYFQQMISALDCCHSHGVYHRDLKPENLLLDEDGNLKISDFGLSALAACKREDGMLHTTCGTPAYVAPEVINRRGYDGAKADIWSCGVILFVLLASYLPFQDKNLMEMYRKIGRAEYKCPSWFSPEVRKLLQRILDPNPSNRIPLSRIMSNYWFRKGLDGKPTTSKKVVKETSSQTEVREDTGQLSDINAFDIIALSEGFDLSSLFEESNEDREIRFWSACPASTIISKMEKVAKALKFTVRKKDHGLIKMEKNHGEQMGPLEIVAEIFVLTPACHLVEIKKISGSASEYQWVWKEQMRPRLEDIVS